MIPATNPGVTYRAKPSELWGVGTGPRVRVRGEAARKRRAAKRAARRAGVPLKRWLRAKGVQS